MAKKIRVHELAKELGMSNAECLELCEKLRVGVTSHSSSMDEPQADRVRKRAEKVGLGGKKPAPKKEAAKKPAPKKEAAKKPTPKKAAVKKETPKAEAPKKPTPKKEAPKKPAPKKSPVGSASSSPPAPAKVPPPARDKKPRSPKPAVSTSAPAPEAKKEKPKKPAGAPLSRSGKPIPPPPRAKSPAPGGSVVAPRRPPRRGHLRPDVVLPSSERQGPPSKPSGKPASQRNQPPYQPRRRRGGRRRRRAPIVELQPVGEPQYTPEDVPVPEGVILVERGSNPQEFAPNLNRTASDIVKYFFDHGETVTPTTQLSDDMIEIYSMEVGAQVQLIDKGEEIEEELKKILVHTDGGEENLVQRSPIITIMGHVDHGKTLLLDQIRKTNVAGGEKGGITQHIGAYQIAHNNSTLTFIDTPGHEAFTSMRARGAQATDIVVLVIAADDGIMPQTIEALNHAKSAKVPILVAINKIDLENSDASRVLQQMAENELIPESYGGDILVSEVSALKGDGIDDLLEKIILVSDLEELKASATGRARGVVLESNLSHGQGPVATLLVSSGTLHIGDPVVAGSAWGKVKAIVNDKGEKIKEAGPSMPVQVLGFSQIPTAGIDFACAPNESIAGKVADKRADIERGASMRRSSSAVSTGASMEDIFTEISRDQAATLNLIVKADTFGSLEAITERLMALENAKLKIAYVHKAVGGITENDIQLALASNATVIGFNIRPEKRISDLAEKESVKIRKYEIIYELIENVEDALRGMLVPEYEEVVTGEAEVREVFHIKGVGSVAGCYVRSGKIAAGSGVRFLRDGAIIWKGEIKTLKRFTDEVSEVLNGNECGIGLSDFQDLKNGDIIETYEEKEIAQTL